MRVVMGSRSTPPAVAASSGQAPRLLGSIKKESPDDEIKEYAETAMNELLGWYGYDKLDSRDTQGLNLHHFAQRSPSDGDSSDAGGSSPGRRDGGTGTGSSQDSPPLSDPICAWCQKTCRTQQLFSLRTPTGQKAFCSEVCFTQCRRANFKRNKTCDWCRHVRHTVNYVDFQDGEHQLQFCSDKCLNQYKMNIFCKETQAHLQLHPHLQEGAGGAGGGLITPDLWLRDCRSVSPISDRSSSPTPTPTIPGPARSSPPLPVPDPALAPKLNAEQHHKENSKLRRQCRPKRGGIRVIASATATSVSGPTDLRTTSSSSPRSGGSVSPPKQNSHLPPHLIPLAAQPPPILHPPPHLLPPHDHHLPRHPLPPSPFLPPGLLPPPSHMFPDPHHPHLPHPHQRFPLLRPPPRGSPPSPSPLHPPPPLLPLPPRLPPPRSLLPPVTIMVPYPIILPIPIPIPIPIPLFPPKMAEPSEEPTAPPAPRDPSPEPVVVPTAPAATKPTSDRPLRKRRRLGVEAVSDEEGVTNRKSVPV